MPSDGREPYRASIYDEAPDFTRVLADLRTGAEEKGQAWKGQWCPGAESNHRHCDFQSHALPTELPGRAAKGPKGPASRRVIVGSDGAVHHASPAASRGAAMRKTEAKRARRSPKGEAGLTP